MAYVGGKDKPEPAGAVIMMGGKKYKHMGPRQPPTDHVYGEITCLAGGGFSVAITEKLLIIGVWEKNTFTSNGGLQDAFKCTN